MAHEIVKLSLGLHERIKGQHVKRDVGLVYIVHALGLGRVKIGYTTRQFAGRLQVIRTGCPVPVEPLIVIGGAKKANELHLHQQFKASHTYREWYWMTQEICEYVWLLSQKPLENVQVWQQHIGVMLDEAKGRD